MRNTLVGALQATAQAIPQMITQGQDPTGLVKQIADVIKARQKGVSIEDAINEVFTPEQPPVGAPQVEQMSPAPAAPAGGALPPQGSAGRPDIQTLLASLTSGGKASASARTSVRR